MYMHLHKSTHTGYNQVSAFTYTNTVDKCEQSCEKHITHPQPNPTYVYMSILVNTRSIHTYRIYSICGRFRSNKWIRRANRRRFCSDDQSHRHLLLVPIWDDQRKKCSTLSTNESINTIVRSVRFICSCVLVEFDQTASLQSDN